MQSHSPGGHADAVGEQWLWGGFGGYFGNGQPRILRHATALMASGLRDGRHRVRRPVAGRQPSLGDKIFGLPCKTARSVVQNGPYCNVKRHILKTDGTDAERSKESSGEKALFLPGDLRCRKNSATERFVCSRNNCTRCCRRNWPPAHAGPATGHRKAWLPARDRLWDGGWRAHGRRQDGIHGITPAGCTRGL